MSTTHKHEWTAVWAHFGEHGDQDAHFHVCYDTRCKALFVGKGINCSKGCEHEVKK